MPFTLEETVEILFNHRAAVSNHVHEVLCHAVDVADLGLGGKQDGGYT